MNELLNNVTDKTKIDKYTWEQMKFQALRPGFPKQMFKKKD